MTYKIRIKNPTFGLPINYLDIHNPEQYTLIGFSRDLAEAQPMSAEFLQLCFAQGNKGHFTSGMKELYYVDKDGRAVIPYMRVLVRKVTKSE